MSRRSTIAPAAALLVGLATTLSLVSTGTAATPTCTPVPQTFPKSQLLLSGSSQTIRPGAIVFAVMVEAGKYTETSYPTTFPWLTARSSDHHVLTPVRVCRQTGMSSLAISVAAFRATHAGKVTVTGPLAPRWAGLKTGPRPYRATVTVRR